MPGWLAGGRTRGLGQSSSLGSPLSKGSRSQACSPCRSWHCCRRMLLARGCSRHLLPWGLPESWNLARKTSGGWTDPDSSCEAHYPLMDGEYMCSLVGWQLNFQVVDGQTLRPDGGGTVAQSACSGLAACESAFRHIAHQLLRTWLPFRQSPW